MAKKIIFSIFIIGLSSIIARVVLLREFLIKFYGNELSIGIILANWLIIEAAGAFFIAKIDERIKQKKEIFAISILIFSLSAPLSVFLIRGINSIMGLLPGEGLGIVFIFWFSFIALLPICFSYGAIFILGCKLYHVLKPTDDVGPIAKLYIYQTTGIVIGGVVFTYFIVGFFSSFQALFCLAILNALTCIILLGAAKITGRVSCLVLFISIFFLYNADSIHRWSLQKQWPKEKVVYYQNSSYGNIAVTEKEKQFTFFNNGTPAFTSPTPNINFIEDAVHLPLLFNDNPKNILVIGSGPGGKIKEILKYPIQKIDYCEINPLIIDAAKLFSASSDSELNNAKVKIHYLDARLFIRQTKDRYGVILIGISNPVDLQTNRIFTEEFYKETKPRLNSDGILVVAVGGSSSALSNELKKLNACIYKTLIRNFPYLRVIPGDTNIIIASFSEDIAAIDPILLAERFRKLNIKTSFISKRYIEYKLSKERQKWYLDSINSVDVNSALSKYKPDLRKGGVKINKDFAPAAVFYSLSYWNLLFSPHTQIILNLLEKFNLGIFIIIVAAAFFIFCTKKTALHYAVITTGFFGMVFDLILIFAFQVFYGYVYYWIGILITAFMAGVAAGSLAITYKLKNIRDDLICFIKIETAIIIYIILSAIALMVIRCMNMDISVRILLLLLLFTCGFLVGAEFPLANKIYFKKSKNIAQTAGSLYAADLIGGSIGGIVAGIVLLPVLGVLNSCLAIGILKLSSIVMLIWYNKSYEY